MGILTKGIFYLAIAGAGAAFATRPDVDEVRTLFRERLAAQITDGSIMPADNAASQALLAACQISPSQCARVLEGAVSMDYTNRYLWASVRASAPGFDPVQCLAAFERLVCG
ncbi:MAG: hypothetical protein H6899_04385 [Rhodobacter sp.]|nr:hypothetical protein [Rhodobacter sp.]